MLRLSHKYDIAITQKICLASIKGVIECPPHAKPTGYSSYLNGHYKSWEWCTDLRDPQHVLFWVPIAEELQLDELMQLCLDCMKGGLQERFHRGGALCGLAYTEQCWPPDEDMLP